ncbi:MAG: ABC transporter ATP-binding protein [Dehalococcoidia bacterium]|nr:ABC transporter ATP-binding protein [Dehalococcoidia bacterium]
MHGPHGARDDVPAQRAAHFPLIRLDHVSRTHDETGIPVRALDDVSLEIARGEFAAIMGPSGSGTSTLMNIIACLDRPTSGTYRFEGHDLGRASDDIRTRLRGELFGFVFEHFRLLPRLSAPEQVELPLVHHIPAHRRARAVAVLRDLGLGDRMDCTPAELSGGEQQRVAIARALVAAPSVLFADEPTGALDPATSHEVMELLTRLAREQGITVILVTHDAAVAAYADRILRMRDGRIVEDTGRREPASA